MIKRIALAGILCLVCSSASAKHLMVEGVLRDNGGAVIDGAFDITYTLYASESAEVGEWTETHVGQDVNAGFFQARLGQSTDLTDALFAQNGELWLGITLAGQPELPRTPLETDPYAFFAQQAQTALGLGCTGCIDASHLASEVAWAAASGPGGAALDLSCTGCVTLEALSAGVMAASNVSYDDTTTQMGVADVQSAIEKLKTLIGTGGGTGGPVNEGAGTVSRYTNQWGLPSYGVATEFLHLMNPTPPKVVMWMYGGQNTGFASANNLIVQSSSFAPNSYSGGVNGNVGDENITVSNASAFNVGDHVLIHQTMGQNAGQWELNAVTGVTGSALGLAKGLEHAYVSNTGTGTERAQIVVAANYNHMEVVSGGIVHQAKTLPTGASDDFSGGIVYVRAQQITVKAGGVIRANGVGFDGGVPQGGNNTPELPGDSECQHTPPKTNSPSCSGGGGGYSTCGSSSCSNGAAGGGGGKVAGQEGKGSGTHGKGGLAHGDAQGSKIFHGGGGGGTWVGHGGTGGGLVVLGAKTIVVENGGKIEANGADGGGSTNGNNFYAGAGGGGGGTVALFAETVQIAGTVQANGGKGYTNNSNGRHGGDGGEGWVLELDPIPGVVNQSFATGVEIWVDGVNVTPSVGDPNGKGHPHYDPVNKKWGVTGTESWSTGPLDLTNVASWTLGEHKVEMKETGGAGGDLKAYFYLIQSFTESKAPPNDTCATPVLLDPNTDPVVISGTTEDTMGKTSAKDDYKQGGCGGLGGPDVVYRIDLTQRALLHAAVVAPFPPKLYLRAGDCVTGEVEVCADKEFTSDPLEAGTYYLVVDSDSKFAKGDFTLAVSTTPAPLPANDTCDSSQQLVFTDGKAIVNATSIYALDDTKGLCPAVFDGGPDVYYEIDVPNQATVKINVVSQDFSPVVYVLATGCGDTAFPISCSASGTLELNGIQGGKYWIVVDGVSQQKWGDFTMTVDLSN